MNAYFMWLVSSLVFGVVGSWLYAHKGRSPFLGFAIGISLNVIALALFFVGYRIGQDWFRSTKKREVV